MQSLPTIREALFIKSLSLIPKHEKIQLLEHILNVNSKYLIFHAQDHLSKEQYDQYLDLSQKLLDGIPLQYVTNTAYFYGHKLFVDSRVLIPRPETEIMVEHVIKNYPSAKHILDLGAGSGAISKAIASAMPQSTVTSVDICSDALEVASQNLEAHKNVSLVQSDLLASVTSDKVDIICANLPYIGTEKFSGVDENVIKHEPKKALFAGSDGLDLYRRLFTQVYNKQLKFQAIIIELADNQAKAASQVVSMLLPHTQITQIKDLNQKIRFLEIKPK